MKNKIFIVVFTLATLAMSAVSVNVFATEPLDPLAIESTEAPSDTYLSRNKSSLGASTDITTLSAPKQGLVRGQDAMNYKGWENPFLPGGDGWELGDTGNVGYPVGDASLPILLSMLLIYFVYRGVSSTKRKNNI